MTSLVVCKVIGEGLVKLERVQVICPVCGQQVEAVATDGRVKGYCTVAEQYVDFPMTPVAAGSQGTADAKKGRHLTAEARAKMSAAKKGKHLTAETKAKISAAITRWHNTKRGSR